MAGRGRELRALITLAGQVDPSVQAAMRQAARLSGETSKSMRLSMDQVGTSLWNLTKKAVKWVTIGMITTAVARFGKEALQLASDLNEVQNVVDVTFGQNSAVINAFAEESLGAYGLTTLQAKQYAGTMGAMLKSMGLADRQVLTMSGNLTALSGDLASFYNLSGEEAFAKIRAGISGETEPLKQLGINMSVANLEAYALSQGITTQISAMSQADQALLRYNYLLSATADQQGDFARTQDSYANQLKLLQGNAQQLAASVAGGLTPALATGMKELNQFIQSVDSKAVAAFAGQIGGLAVQFMPLVGAILPVFGELLGQALPLLVEIGQSIIPPLVTVIQAIFQAITPVLPLLGTLIRTLLPPLQSVLKIITPLVAGLAQVFVYTLAPAVELISSILSPFLELLQKVLDALSGTVDTIGQNLESGVLQDAVNQAAMQQSGQYLPAFAQGGFSDQPAIFGEAGLEAAIPIKPGNIRSLGLLRRTAELLGVEEHHDQRQQVIQWTYAPNIYTNDPTVVEGAVQRGSRWLRQQVEDLMQERGRLRWD